MRSRDAVPIEALAPSGAFTGALVIATVSSHSQRWIPAMAAAALLCAFVFVWSLWTSTVGAVLAVISAALFADGFIANRYGVLTWDGRTDGEWLCAIVAAGLLGRIVRAVISQPHRAGRISRVEILRRRV